MDLKDIKELMRMFDKSDIAEFEIEKEDYRIYFSKNSPHSQPMMSYAPGMSYQPNMGPMMNNNPASTPAIAEPVSAQPKVPEVLGNEILSPMIGTYYYAPSPSAEPFVTEGKIVEKGQTLCIIEAMKIMNEIEAEYRCRIVKLLLENGKSVEYGQPIFIVEPM